MKRILFGSLAFVLLVSSVSCQKTEPIRVGSKNFSENKILAHMIRLVAKQEKLPVHPSIVYGNTFDLQEAIKRGEIQVYPEYTGTGALLMGSAPAEEREASYTRVQELFEPFGLVWQKRFGFDNAYTLVMTNQRAVSLDVKTISDLAALEQRLVFGADPEFMARPVDGFSSLIRRYGISPEPDIVREETRKEIFRDLIQGKTQVAVAQKTDPQILEYGLVILEDDLDFFSVYEPAPVVRQDALKKYEALGPALEKLGGVLDVKTMRILNHWADISGVDERIVAERFLRKQGLITLSETLPKQRELVIAAPPADHRTELTALVSEAVRSAVPNRELEIRSFEDPVQTLSEGGAFAAVLGAEHFFKLQPKQLPERSDQIEAIAPVGHRFGHLIRKKSAVIGENSDSTQGPFAGMDRLGVGVENSSSARMARILLDAYDALSRVTQVTGPLNTLIEALKKDRLDAVFIMTIPGDFHVAQILEDSDLDLQSIGAWRHRDRRFRYPFIHEGRITPSIYPELERPVDTVHTQVVIAGPRMPEQVALGDGDPMSGLRTKRQPIPLALKKKLVAGTGLTETIDPALPGENVSLLSRRREALPLNPQPAVSLVTGLFFILFIGLLFALFKKKPQ
ncbi:MAG: glycine betaine ABC transporter substrate-binding protein [Thermodesulfobacteriota bacterium]